LNWAGEFKVVEVSHEFYVSPLKHVVVVAVEAPTPVAGKLIGRKKNACASVGDNESAGHLCQLV
jgi:hypothetical protein